MQDFPNPILRPVSVPCVIGLRVRRVRRCREFVINILCELDGHHCVRHAVAILHAVRPFVLLWPRSLTRSRWRCRRPFDHRCTPTSYLFSFLSSRSLQPTDGARSRFICSFTVSVIRCRQDSFHSITDRDCLTPSQTVYFPHACRSKFCTWYSSAKCKICRHTRLFSLLLGSTRFSARNHSRWPTLNDSMQLLLSLDCYVCLYSLVNDSEKRKERKRNDYNVIYF